MKATNKQIQSILANFDELNGTKFVGIRNYKSAKSGEVADFVVNANFNYGTAVNTSIAILKSLNEADFEAIAKKYGVTNHEGEKYATNKGAVEFLESGKLPKEGTKARDKVMNGVHKTKTIATIVGEMIQSFVDNQNPLTRSKQSESQREKYDHVAKSVKQHKVNETYHIYALAHSKEVIEEGEYSDSAMGIEASQKNAIERYCKDVKKRINSKGKEVSAELPTCKYRNFVLTEGELADCKELDSATISMTGATYQV